MDSEKGQTFPMNSFYPLRDELSIACSKKMKKSQERSRAKLRQFCSANRFHVAGKSAVNVISDPKVGWRNVT